MSLTEHHRQGLDWSCENVNKRLDAVESERDRLKAELSALLKRFSERAPLIPDLQSENTRLMIALEQAAVTVTELSFENAELRKKITELEQHA